MNPTVEKLIARMQELKDLSGLIGLATWDQETYLPHKGEGARASQLGTLQGLYHERLTAPALGELLGAAGEVKELTADQRAMIRVLEWERRRALNVPPELVRRLAEAQSHALAAWRQARQQHRFDLFRPKLEELLAIRREQADAIGHRGERYDALLDGYEPGMTVARLSPVLDALEQKLVPLVAQITERHRADADPLEGKSFDGETQWRFTLRLLKDMGFDLEAGRQDRSIHPFTGGTHPRDVRLTTRIDESSLTSALFSTIHEGGHGLYEQGFAEEHHRTPLAAAPSMGLHESQSRLWENIIGRSRAFWRHYYPLLRADFPAQLGGVPEEVFLRSVNHVAPSLIRVEADEVTYNLHILLRFGLERVLLTGELPVADLPGEWNARTRKLLGITPPDDVSGVLQDIHWAWGEFGYFPTYTLGNLYAASIWRALRRDLPDVEERLGRGELVAVRDWLREKLHRHGFRQPAEELVRSVTGEGLTDAPFLEYLRTKYLS